MDDFRSNGCHRTFCYDNRLFALISCDKLTDQVAIRGDKIINIANANILVQLKIEQYLSEQFYIGNNNEIQSRFNDWKANCVHYD